LGGRLGDTPVERDLTGPLGVCRQPPFDCFTLAWKQAAGEVALEPEQLRG
jgi:hypothetical protein